MRHSNVLRGEARVAIGKSTITPAMWTAAAGLVLATVLPSSAVLNTTLRLDCNPPGDTIGSVVASGGDFNGDGVMDFAYSAPCTTIGSMPQAGRVFVRSGKTDRIFKRVRGTQIDGFLGARLAFVGDIDGDGKDELAVGSPGFDVLDISLPDTILLNAGKVDIYSRTQAEPILTILGKELNALFGSSIAGISDVNGDGVRDLVIGATGEKKPLRSRRTGAVHTYSGANGLLLDTIYGDKTGQRHGTTVTNIGSIDGDENDEIVVTAFKSPEGGVEESGYYEVKTVTEFTGTELFWDRGAKKDRLGESSDSTGDDNRFIVGAPGRNLDGLRDVGVVVAYDSTGTRLFEVADNNAQKLAAFGHAVAALGDVNGDGVGDYAASAPFADYLISQTEGFLLDAGRISILDGTNGARLWSADGDFLRSRMGFGLAGGIDYNNDGVPDVVAGSPGDAPKGRRGAGSVKILSGSDGEVLAEFAGKRGVESRIFTFANGPDGRVRSFNGTGKRAEVNARVINQVTGNELSIAVIGESQDPPALGDTRIAVGTGQGGREPVVQVIAGDRRKRIHSKFNAAVGFAIALAAEGATDIIYDEGVTVAAGDLNNNGDQKLIVGMADTPTFDVDVLVLRELEAGATDFDGWLLDNFFRVFNGLDEIDTGIDGVPTPIRINANGANLAVGNLTPNAGREIVAAPIQGVPVIRVFTRDGIFVSEWLAYNNQTTSGVSLAVADLDGDGQRQLLTAPMSGPPLVKAFKGNGVPFVPVGSVEPVAFLAEGFDGGLRVAAADIDLDGKHEIIVAGSGIQADRVRAYETDGTQVEGFRTFRPYNGDARNGGTAIAATDRFVPRN